MADWKRDHANAAEHAIRHPLVQEVIDEFLGNIGVRRDALVTYGIHKVCSYAAQVARAEALGIPVESLTSTSEEQADHMRRIAQMALDEGVPVMVIEAPADTEGEGSRG